ncbi:hypothetical protein GCM10011371_13150 [Novosphingobium marinum]|uniref:Uncharacterized protein n=1 Tax=Novosphingobium marinum TaxID=1514948 RepID=A0A7Y9XY55_9SPHN|nr:hypothetical protein [Novosphingobium marinum]NYH95423.1 hypothetical protein [Novosphingobium marinum]GGC26958.1 hypothetical protein GCM10011371_13150 [Novosphingobium marinum]
MTIEGTTGRPTVSATGPTWDTHPWHARLAEYRQVCRDLDAINADCDPLDRERSARFGADRNPCELAPEEASELAAWEAASGYNAVVAEIERLGDLISDLRWELMERPAPDRAALLWKIEITLGWDEDGDDFTPGFAKKYIAQVLRDARRFLGG